MLHLLGGLLTPSSGAISLGQEPVSTLSESRRRQIRLNEIGFIFQFGELLPELTLVENVELPRLFAGSTRAQSRAAALEALEFVGLAELRGRFITQVSGGEQQRAAVARALVHRPSLILADEPTGSLDEDAAARVLDLIEASVRGRSASAVIVTHSQEVADRCDRCLVLEQGTLQPLSGR